ncbi:MAG: hypothetical protein AB7M93_25835 [Candidatus Obscuribacterales bacterium]
MVMHMDPTWNPVCFVNYCFNSNESLPDKAASAFLHSSRVVDIHYGAWLERRRWTTIAHDPDRLPEYILASYLSETVDIVQLAKDIPIIGKIVPSKKWILLPARIIAMARLCIDCRAQHELIRKASEEHRKQMLSFEDKPSLLECFDKEIDWAIEPLDWQRRVLASSDSASSKLAQCALCNFMVVLGAVQVPFRASGKYVDNYFESVNTKANQLEWLASAYHELAMRYVHLYKTAQGDEYAIKDALLRMPEHLEVLGSEGKPVLKKIIDYCQHHWIGISGLELLSPTRCKNALTAWKEGAKRLAPITNSEAATAIPRKQLEATCRPILDKSKGPPANHTSDAQNSMHELLEQEPVPNPNVIQKDRSSLLRQSPLLVTVGATVIATIIFQRLVMRLWRMAS